MLRKIQETNKVKVFCRSSYSSKLVNEKGLKNMSGMSLSSVTQSCLTLCIPMDCRTPGFSVLYQCPELAQTYVHQVGDPIQPSHPVVPFSSCLQSFVASVFSDESILHMRWPKYWSFSFSISPSNEYPGLISFRMDWLDLLAVQGTLKSLL